MKPNDTYETAELFSDADFKVYINCGWTLLDIKAGHGSCPVIYLVGKEKNTETSGGKDHEK